MLQASCYVQPDTAHAQLTEFPAFTVRERIIVSLTPRQRELMRQAIALFQDVMNDEQFHTELQALRKVKTTATIKRSERFTKFKVAKKDQNAARSAETIITNLFNGTEYFEPRDANNRIIIDNEADIFWRIQQRERCLLNTAGRRVCSNVRGSTHNRPRRDGRIRDRDFHINTRSWFVNSVVNRNQRLSNLVQHLAHEWTHKFGFIDTGIANNTQLFTYTFGRLVKRVADRIMSERNRNRPRT